MNRKYFQGEYTGERALFNTHHALIENSVFFDGESPLKESSDYIVNHSTFKYKYPLWYSKDVEVNHCHFEEMARSGIWYTHRITINDSIFNCPKTFRHSSDIVLNRVCFNKGDETLWNCDKIKMTDCKSVGDYLCFNSENIYVKNLHLVGNYFCDGAKNVEVVDSYLDSKDAFWNCENVTIKNTTIIGEYFGWNSKNMTLINCHIESLQGFCYIENLKMIGCTTKDTSLAFEFASGEVEIIGHIDSIKNPTSGLFVADSCGELILEKEFSDPNKVKVIVKNEI